MSTESTRAASRWITRTLPLVLAAAVGYTTYVTVVRACVDFLIGAQRNHGAAIAVLVLYFFFMLLMIATYLRLVVVINVNPGLVPLGPLALERRKSEKAKAARRSRHSDDLEGQPYNSAPDPNPDSPGLEQFYTKDVFICENDGRPKWCSECCNWKPDRAHHSSELNRCVLRMDHYCPWAGGMIGENSFKFFVQFTAYTCCYCAVVLGANGSSLKKKLGFGESVDGYMIGALALGGFFGLFTFMMTLTSLRYISVNMTNVDMIGAKSKVYQLAVRVPRGSPGTDKYNVVNYPLPDGQGNSTAASTGTRVEMAERRQAQSQEARDALAHRTFAILKTEAGENPWDLGFRENWKQVMGTSVVDWFLPIRRSPCISHDQTDSFYRMGPLLPKLRGRHGLAPAVGDNEGFEMADVAKNRP